MDLQKKSEEAKLSETVTYLYASEKLPLQDHTVGGSPQ